MHKHALDARTFRALAERAHGARNATTWFVVAADGTITTEQSELEPIVGEDEFTIPFRVNDRVGARRSLARFELQGEGLRAVDLMRNFEQPADSVYVTESAVEKFLVPYYAAHASAEVAARVLRVFNGEEKPDVYAEEEVLVVGLVHLPKSDYVPTPETPANLGIIYVVRGEVRTELVAEYLERKAH